MKKLIASIMVVAMVFGTISMTGVNVKASEKKAFSAVAKAYGKSYPLSSKNVIKTSRKNIFGKYSKVLGVSAKYFKSYKAASKKGKCEYVSAIFKATSKANVAKIKKALKTFVSKEKSSGANYFSAKGKGILNKAKVGSKGKYVYLFVLDNKGNSKAIKAFKKNA